MRIIDLKIVRDTERYKFFWVQYTTWYNPDSIKDRYGFIMKSNEDCFWSDTGTRLNARTERAVLALVEHEENASDVTANDMIRKLNFK